VSPFALVDRGQSHVAETTPDAAAGANGDVRLLWIHLDGQDPKTKDFLTDRLGLTDIVASALTAIETRPRCDAIGSGALINLRGRSLEDEPEADELVSLRIWTQRGCIVSVGRYTIRALPLLKQAMLDGHVRDPGDFVAMLADAITDDLDPEVADLGDRLDDCEVMLDTRNAFQLRRSVATARSEAIEYRRFVAPQRIALERLAALEFDWLEADDRLQLNEAADRFARMAEELESIRERAGLMSEQITDLRAELIDIRSLWLSIAALIFLPLTFLTGLLGMNVKGIPYAEEPWAFWGVVGVCVVLAGGSLVFFIRSHWLR
jgi:zinc transporter